MVVLHSRIQVLNSERLGFGTHIALAAEESRVPGGRQADGAWEEVFDARGYRPDGAVDVAASVSREPSIVWMRGPGGTPFTFEPNRVYRIDFTVGGNALSSTLTGTPAFRLRVNAANLQYATAMTVESTGETLAHLPRVGTDKTDSLWILPPDGILGTTPILSFDYLYAGSLSFDDPRIALTLRGYTVTRYAVLKSDLLNGLDR